MQPANSQEALTQLQQTQGGARSAADILSNQRQQMGVGAAQDTIQGLRGAITNTTKLLNQVAPSVMGRTANSLVTNAQATRQIANEQQPIAQQLSQTTGDYNTALSDYDRTSSRASEAANAEYGDQQNKLSYMQNLYNTLFGREQAAQQAEEEKRRFNEQMALERTKLSRSGGAGNYFDGLGGANAQTVTPQGGGATLIKESGGFNFKDANGQPINAAQYAQAKGIGYRELLSKMASEGDKNAQIALNYVGNDAMFGSAPRGLQGALNALGASGNFVDETPAPATSLWSLYNRNPENA